MRNKIYYPPNEINVNLYTFGNEFMIDNVEYKGFYHTYSTGEVYTLKRYKAGKSKKLKPFKKLSQEILKYKKLKPGLKTKNIYNTSKSTSERSLISQAASLNDIIIPPDINDSAI
jgi:hypothetical protein